VLEQGEGSDQLLAVANVAGTAQAQPLAKLPFGWQGPTFIDACTGELLPSTAGQVVLLPYGFWWLMRTA
jgi:hypothetical protein